MAAMNAVSLPDPAHRVERVERVGLPRLPISIPCLVALLSLYWALLANRAFLSGAQAALQRAAGRGWDIERQPGRLRLITIDALCAGLARQMGYAISNVDVTLICERPKVGPHAGAMMQMLAAIIGIAADRVSVKATTSERLGFTGREEGIAAIATATLVKA